MLVAVIKCLSKGVTLKDLQITLSKGEQAGVLQARAQQSPSLRNAVAKGEVSVSYHDVPRVVHAPIEPPSKVVVAPQQVPEVVQETPKPKTRRTSRTKSTT